MKAVISSTHDSIYSFFIPITTWCWNKLGIDVILFVPNIPFLGPESIRQITLMHQRMLLVEATCKMNKSKVSWYSFNAPYDKQSTYAQCSRLYAGALDLPEDEILITSDVDMAVFTGFNDFLVSFDASVSQKAFDGVLKIIGFDLVPEGQYPMCYAIAPVARWRKFMQIDERGFLQCLDDQLSAIECENMRGNLWSRDQELLFMYTQKKPKIQFLRARPGTQFASCRVDRTDANWRSYLGEALVDAHLWREGYIDHNFANILELLTFQYPEENFQWLIDYKNAYIELL